MIFNKDQPLRFDIAREEMNLVNIALPDIYIAVRLYIEQYNIRGRKWNANVAPLAAAALHNQGNLHELSTYAYAADQALPTDVPRETVRNGKTSNNNYVKITKSSGVEWKLKNVEADLTVHCPLTQRVQGDFQLTQDDSRDQVKIATQKLNNSLGQALAIHIKRDKTVTPPANRADAIADFARLRQNSAVATVAADTLVATEKCGMVVHAYLKVNIEGKDQIIELVDGAFGSVVDEASYNQQKRLTPNVYTDASGQGGVMPLIPGVSQIYILITERNNQFVLEEVYSDGDLLYVLE